MPDTSNEFDPASPAPRVITSAQLSTLLRETRLEAEDALAQGLKDRNARLTKLIEVIQTLQQLRNDPVADSASKAEQFLQRLANSAAPPDL